MRLFDTLEKIEARLAASGGPFLLVSASWRRITVSSARLSGLTQSTSVTLSVIRGRSATTLRCRVFSKRSITRPECERRGLRPHQAALLLHA